MHGMFKVFLKNQSLCYKKHKEVSMNPNVFNTDKKKIEIYELLKLLKTHFMLTLINRTINFLYG